MYAQNYNTSSYFPESVNQTDIWHFRIHYNINYINRLVLVKEIVSKKIFDKINDAL